MYAYVWVYACSPFIGTRGKILFFLCRKSIFDRRGSYRPLSLSLSVAISLALCICVYTRYQEEGYKPIPTILSPVRRHEERDTSKQGEFSRVEKSLFFLFSCISG